MEKSRSDQSFAILFKHIDNDKDGLITFKEISSFFSHIEKDLPDINIKEIFLTSEFEKDDKIGLEEFQALVSNKLGLNTSIVLMRVPQYLKDISKPIDSLFKFSEEDSGSFQKHYANITFGEEFTPKSQAILSLDIGNKAEQIYEELTKGFSHTKKDCGIFFSVITKNPTKAEESIKYLIPRFLSWVNEILPAKSDLDFKQLKEVTTIEDDTVKILLEPENRGINDLFEQYKKVQSRIIPEGLEGFANLEVNFKKDIESILEEEFDTTNQTIPKKNLLAHIFEGATAKLKGCLTESILNKLRDEYLKSRTFAKLPEGMRNMAFLLLWKSTKIDVAFKRIRASFLEEMLPKGWDFGIEKILNDIKEYIIPLQKKHAILKTLLIVMEKEFLANFKICIKIPGAILALEAKTRGIQEIYTYISTQN